MLDTVMSSKNKRIQPWIIYLTRAVKIRNRIMRGKVHISKERLDVIFSYFSYFTSPCPYLSGPYWLDRTRSHLIHPLLKKLCFCHLRFWNFSWFTFFKSLSKLFCFFPWLLPRLVAKRPPFFLPHLPWDGISHGFEFRQQEKSKWFFSFLGNSI